MPAKLSRREAQLVSRARRAGIEEGRNLEADDFTRHRIRISINGTVNTELPLSHIRALNLLHGQTVMEFPFAFPLDARPG